MELHFIEAVIFLISMIAAGIASIAGFGIGSLVTPILSLSVETKLAVALVSIPHFVATALRFWMLRQQVDKKVLMSFGLMSAAGSLTGAFLFSQFANPALTLVFGGILIFAGFMGLTGLSGQLRFYGWGAWLAGGISGFLGGLVGNQGGIRAAALLNFQISRDSFVATATAIGLIVDLSRMPIYFWSEWEGIASSGTWILLTTTGVIIGTFLGGKLLRKIPETAFRRTVSLLIFTLGIFMIYRALIS